jgi:hypothetical protein
MAKPKHLSQPARRIIDALGGCRSVARALKIAPSTVTRWSSEKDCKGRIPARHWSALIELAEQSGFELTLNDLFPGGEKSAT